MVGGGSSTLPCQHRKSTSAALVGGKQSRSAVPEHLQHIASTVVVLHCTVKVQHKCRAGTPPATLLGLLGGLSGCAQRLVASCSDNSCRPASPGKSPPSGPLPDISKSRIPMVSRGSGRGSCGSGRPEGRPRCGSGRPEGRPTSGGQQHPPLEASAGDGGERWRRRTARAANYWPGFGRSRLDLSRLRFGRVPGGSSCLSLWRVGEE